MNIAPQIVSRDGRINISYRGMFQQNVVGTFTRPLEEAVSEFPERVHQTISHEIKIRVNSPRKGVLEGFWVGPGMSVEVYGEPQGANSTITTTGFQPDHAVLWLTNELITTLNFEVSPSSPRLTREIRETFTHEKELFGQMVEEAERVGVPWGEVWKATTYRNFLTNQRENKKTTAEATQAALSRYNLAEKGVILPTPQGIRVLNEGGPTPMF